MKLTLDLSKNTLGMSSKRLFFNEISDQYPNFGINMGTHDTVLVKSHSTSVYANRAIAIVRKNNDYSTSWRFHFARFDLAAYVKPPLFTKAELTAIDITSEVSVLAAIVNKTGRNIDSEDIWFNYGGIEYTGGEHGPNWRLKAREDSHLWCGEVIIPLYV